MQQPVAERVSAEANSDWLRAYYFTRAVVAAGWVGLAFTAGRSSPAIAGALLVAYPAWDALANGVDAWRSGGLRRSPSQALNLIVSALAAVAVAVALGRGMNAVLGVFGVWAALAGLLQLMTGARRWKTFGAQWSMILSGAQSTLAGVAFIAMARGPKTPDITVLAGYAAFGAVYFLVSAVWLTFAARRRVAA